MSEPSAHSADPAVLDYETSKAFAVDPDPRKRSAIAGNPSVRPELLYFLAQDADVDVRRAVAANQRAPRHADLLLAGDADETVRLTVADKMARLGPTLDAQARDRPGHLTLEVLDLLARDALMQVRRILSEALKELSNAPPQVIQRLAKDRELDVSGPVLQFSPVLSDADLLEIITSPPVQGALTAISRRHGLADHLSRAVAESGDVAATAALLANETAQIREETLDWIIDRASPVIAWHAPLARRPRLHEGAARRIASFVARELLEEMADRKDLPAAALASVVEVLAERRAATDEPAAAPSPRAPLSDGATRARSDHAASLLTPVAVQSAIERQDNAYVIEALALLAELPSVNIAKAIETKNAKALSIVGWRAKLTPMAIVALQAITARIQPKSIIRPLGDGVPSLPTHDLLWELELLSAEP